MSDARETIASILREGAHEYDTTGEGPSDVDTADAILAALSRADLAPKVSVQDAAKVLLDAHTQASNVPPSDRTPVQNDVAQMGRNRLSRIASALVAHGEEA